MACTASLDLSDEEVDRLAAEPEGESFLDSDGHFRCDLTAGHSGRHVALVDHLALDEDPPFTAPWLWWDATRHEATFGKSCIGCTLPEGHPTGSGCSSPHAQPCASTVSITLEEADALGDLPYAVHQVDSTFRCQYLPSHAGDHVSLGQSQDDDESGTSTAWWIIWPSTGGTGHEIKVMAECSAPDGDALCMHPTGHPGEHWF